MAYQFAGFFAKPPVAQPNSLPANAVWRAINSPFDGVGVRIASFTGSTPDMAVVSQLAQQLGLTSGDWLYLTYVCWGGAIDFVYGFGARDGQAFGPVEESGRNVVDVYTGLMEAFGVTAEDALQFAPFVRGFWGED